MSGTAEAATIVMQKETVLTVTTNKQGTNKLTMALGKQIGRGCGDTDRTVGRIH